MRDTYSIGELTEALLLFGIIYDHFPFVEVHSHQFVHLTFEILANAKLIVQDYLPQFLYEASRPSAVMSQPLEINATLTSIPPSMDSSHRAVRMSLSAVRM